MLCALANAIENGSEKSQVLTSKRLSVKNDQALRYLNPFTPQNNLRSGNRILSEQ